MDIAAIYDVFKLSSGVCTDTRAITNNCLFIALKGANFNGNEFALEALKEGAIAVIVDENISSNNPAVITVANALATLQQLANFHRKQFNIPLLAITGSNGKTTTKELLNSVMSTSKNVLCTQGNLNNHIGVPLTLLQLTAQHEFAIIEMGANKPGDILELCEIAEPDYGIITNVGKAHLKGFGSFEGVIQTKTELYRFLNNKQTIFVNTNDDYLTKELNHLTLNKIGYSMSNETENSSTHTFNSLTSCLPYAAITYKGKPIKSNLIGAYNSLNIAAACSIGLHFGLNEQEVIKGIESYQPSNNRSELQESESNTIIWDAYNANPSSMKLAIENLAHINSSKTKVAILGDMNELGEYAKEEHQSIIDLISQTNIKPLFVGPIFEKHSCEPHFESVDDLKHYLKESPLTNSYLLIKGSRSIQLEKLKDIFS